MMEIFNHLDLEWDPGTILMSDPDLHNAIKSGYTCKKSYGSGTCLKGYFGEGIVRQVGRRDPVGPR
jgi:hypothetical protein